MKQPTPIEPPRQPGFRVAVVEDERLFRESWARRIDSYPDFKCVCKCGSGEEAIEKVPEARPDVILMDILLPGISGIDCTAHLKKALPESLIVILTALD